jgi:DNA-binding FrmR family transcriptional regulator
MSLAARRRTQLIYRSKRIAGQFELIHRGLQRNMDRKEILERVSAARYSVCDLLAQLLEEEILDRPHDTEGKTQDEIVDSMMEILRTYIG